MENSRLIISASLLLLLLLLLTFLGPIDPLPVIGMVDWFNTHASMRVDPVFRVDHDLCSNSCTLVTRRDRKLVLEYPSYDELEWILDHLLPSRAAARLGLVARFRETELPRRDMTLAREWRGLKSQSLVEVENAAEEHRLRVVGVVQVRVRPSFLIARRAPVSLFVLRWVGVPVGGVTSSIPPPSLCDGLGFGVVRFMRADVLAFREDVHIHVADRDAQRIGIDCTHQQVQHQLLLAGQDILYLVYSDILERPVRSKDEEYGGDDDEDEHERGKHACAQLAPEAPAVLSSVLVFKVVRDGVSSASRDTMHVSAVPWSPNRPGQKRLPFIVCILFSIEIVGVLLLPAAGEQAARPELHTLRAPRRIWPGAAMGEMVVAQLRSLRKR